MLQAINLRKSYNSLEVLKGIDLTIKRAEIVSIVGSSGAGKSTLLHILGTLDNPDSGEVLFDGQSLRAWGAPRWPSFATGTSASYFSFTTCCPSLQPSKTCACPPT